MAKDTDLENDLTASDELDQEDDSDYDSNGAESEDSSDEEDMDEEPKLRYRRVGAGVRDILEKDTASTLRVSGKFVVRLLHFGIGPISTQSRQ